MSCTESEAIVDRVEGGTAFVRLTQALSSCGRCNDRGGCGKNALVGSDAPPFLAIPNEIGARAGDAVVLALPQGVLLRAALLAYVLPALLAILGAGTGAMLSPDDGVTPLVGAALGLALGVVALRRYSLRQTLPTMRLKQISIQ